MVQLYYYNAKSCVRRVARQITADERDGAHGFNQIQPCLFLISTYHIYHAPLFEMTNLDTTDRFGRAQKISCTLDGWLFWASRKERISR